MNLERSERIEIPVLPLRDVVVYPHMVIPLFVGREKSIRCLEAAMEQDKKVLLVAQKDASTDEPTVEEIFSVGTVANILQMLKLPDGTVKVLVEGGQRARLERMIDDRDFFVGEAQYIASAPIEEKDQDVLVRSAIGQFEGYIKLNKKIPPEVLTSISAIDDAARLADTMAAHMPLKLEDKQKVLEIASVSERIEFLMAMMESEIDLLQVEKRIRSRVKKQMEKSQREYYLNEQMKAIQKELGELEDSPDEFEALNRKIEEAGMPEDAREKAQAELAKLKMMSPMSAEATVVRSYVDWMVQVPWKARSKVKKDLGKAQEVLDADHYGLDKVKDRILEYLAVQARVNKLKGPILCLVGPPGVGKTSLGQSIAKATGRKYVRMALGGVRDEAEIRGHRRTYIGSMPGKLIQKMAKVGVKNPLFLLDEIDKMSSDMRGDPASALLEVLDPEQNKDFLDHYLDVRLDLSQVLFICTANDAGGIPEPLRDRMEVIRLAGYTEEDKLHIARRHLIPRQIENHGLKPEQVAFGDESLKKLIREYTREAGLRNLEREVASITRKIARRHAEGRTEPVAVTPELVEEFLGAPYFMREELEERTYIPGVAVGLSWTPAGGDVLYIEATQMWGQKGLTLTGQLGDVMKESAQAALSWVRAHARQLGIEESFFERVDLHLHVPEGAIPKDGPSAGVTLVTSLVSLLTGRPVRPRVAMTGEVTLSGRVLPVGGIKEKVLAAHRMGIKEVILPKRNEKQAEEDIPENVRNELKIHLVSAVEEVLELVLMPGDPYELMRDKNRWQLRLSN